MIHIRKRNVLIAASTIVLGGAVATATLTAGAAHAQNPDSISITGVTGVSGNINGFTLDASVTCTAGAFAQVSGTAIQGSTYTGRSGNVHCTGSPQAISIPLTSSASIGVGPGFAGATLEAFATPSTPNTFVGTTTTLNFP